MLVVASPIFHRRGVVEDFGIGCIERESAIHFPGNIGELQHGHGDVADRDWRIQLVPMAHGGDEVGKVKIGHGVAAHGVG